MHRRRSPVSALKLVGCVVALLHGYNKHSRRAPPAGRPSATAASLVCSSVTFPRSSHRAGHHTRPQRSNSPWRGNRPRRRKRPRSTSSASNTAALGAEYRCLTSPHTPKRARGRCCGTRRHKSPGCRKGGAKRPETRVPGVK